MEEALSRGEIPDSETILAGLVPGEERADADHDLFSVELHVHKHSQQVLEFLGSRWIQIEDDDVAEAQHRVVGCLVAELRKSGHT